MELSDIRSQAKRAGESPGSLVYTGRKKNPTQVTVVNYSAEICNEETSDNPNKIIELIDKPGTNWIQVEGFNNLEILSRIQEHYKIHPLTAEDILTGQRAKLEEFDHYIFVTLKTLRWEKKRKKFAINQISIILGNHFVITFSDAPVDIFKKIEEKMKSNPKQRLREQGADYLFYRLIDAIIDQYFIILETLGELIDDTETLIISSPTRGHMRRLYRMKRETLMLRKSIWPMREAVSHLSQLNDKFISQFTRLYLRDVYDHTMQAIDTIETYRDMLSSMLDVYISSLTNRLNEVMKTLTVISTIFIPITFIASLYGMNFINMPELKWQYGYVTTLGAMGLVVIVMLVYFNKKKWF
ncbi:MAG: magnesium/cobalt transporter CorA [Gammaproteobacteria bacterium]|nr:magnesium/cobalt transporter CorA [Gammaproteobacteria bacterium]